MKLDCVVSKNRSYFQQVANVIRLAKFRRIGFTRDFLKVEVSLLPSPGPFGF